METDDITLLQRWISGRSDLMAFEIVPVVEGKETAQALSGDYIVRCLSHLLAHRVILWQCSTPVAFGAKRTCTGRRNRLDRSKMTQIKRHSGS
jgi:hypothetical protein